MRIVPRWCAYPKLFKLIGGYSCTICFCTSRILIARWSICNYFWYSYWFWLQYRFTYGTVQNRRSFILNWTVLTIATWTIALSGRSKMDGHKIRVNRDDFLTIWPNDRPLLLKNVHIRDSYSKSFTFNLEKNFKHREKWIRQIWTIMSVSFIWASETVQFCAKFDPFSVHFQWDDVEFMNYHGSFLNGPCPDRWDLTGSTLKPKLFDYHLLWKQELKTLKKHLRMDMFRSNIKHR